MISLFGKNESSCYTFMESDTTKIIRLEEQMKTVQDQVQNVDKNVGLLRSDTEKKFNELYQHLEGKFGDLNKTILDSFEKADKKYANHWVEDAVVWGIRIVVGAVILALLGLVIVKSGAGGV